MNYDPSNVDVLTADTAIINEAQITRKVATQPKFSILLLVFFVGALSFAVALSYNNFAQALITKYSFGTDGILATFINMLIFTVIAIGILYIVWKTKPQVIGSVLL